MKNFVKSFFRKMFVFSLMWQCVFAGLPVLAAPAITPEDFEAAMITADDRFDDTSSQNFRPAVKSIINYFLTFLGLICVAMMVYAGILLITDAGGEENVGKAKNIILWAVVGIILILLSWSLTSWIFNAVQ